MISEYTFISITCLRFLYISRSNSGLSLACRTVPKPPRKTRPMEVKGRRVFGVPLLLSAQQTGEPIPPCILRALVYLRTNCLDQVNQQKPAGIEEAVFNKLCQKCRVPCYSVAICVLLKLKRQYFY